MRAGLFQDLAVVAAPLEPPPENSAADEGMPFGYSQISIPGPAHDGDGSEQGLEDDLE
jgi:hypothetical protein